LLHRGREGSQKHNFSCDVICEWARIEVMVQMPRKQNKKISIIFATWKKNWSNFGHTKRIVHLFVKLKSCLYCKKFGPSLNNKLLKGTVSKKNCGHMTYSYQ
jgi:hypothetical protein